MRSLASFSSFLRSSCFRFSSFYGRVRIASRWNGRGHNTPRAFPRVPWLPSLPSHLQAPSASFPSAMESERCSVGKTWFTTYLESFLAISGPLFFLLALEFLPSLFLLRSSQNDVQSKLGLIAHLELFFQFPGLPLFLFAFEFLTFPFLLQ